MLDLLTVCPLALTCLSMNTAPLLSLDDLNFYLPLEDNHGILIEEEQVSSPTKCYIEKNTIPVLKKLGKDIEKDNSNGTERYYYLATTTSPMISAITYTTDDVVRLRRQIEVVENTAITFQATIGRPNPYYMDNLTLMYLRSFNKNYSIDDDNKKDGEGNSASKFVGWTAAAGALNPAFIKLADPIFVDGIQCRTFFAQYVTKNEYAESLHKRGLFEFVHNSDLEFGKHFRDPINDNDHPTTNKTIDLIHMFASIDGCYDYTLAANNFIGLGSVEAKTIHDLTSWAGDLQTAAKKLVPLEDKIHSKYLNFADIMNDSHLGCTEDDILADIDAANITDSYLTGPGRLNDALGQYYSNTDTQTKRFQKFVTGVLHDENSNWVGTNNQKFEQEVYDDLALTYDPTTKTINDYSSSVDIINKNLKKFAILTRGSSSFPSFKIRKFVARSFIDYVEARI